jgi:hypothetical protein
MGVRNHVGSLSSAFSESVSREIILKSACFKRGKYLCVGYFLCIALRNIISTARQFNMTNSRSTISVAGILSYLPSLLPKAPCLRAPPIVFSKPLKSSDPPFSPVKFQNHKSFEVQRKPSQIHNSRIEGIEMVQPALL